MQAKPFLKWAGGKGQLLQQIEGYLPNALKVGKIKRYVEPFVGSGALFFYVAQRYQVDEFIIADINPELAMAYRVIQQDVAALIGLLQELQDYYWGLSATARKVYFYETRSRFNTQRNIIDFNNYSEAWIGRTVQLLFLNRTCFNGLFRVNRKGEFNVPMGRYKNPRFCNAENLQAVSRLLQRTRILRGDFEVCEGMVDRDTFVYFDPPYRPVSETANFTHYAGRGFDDNEQLRLRDFFELLDDKGAKLMLSNSDSDFFDVAYRNYTVIRLEAKRHINSNKSKRGVVKEVLIMNYESGMID
ncbi:MAG: DNA adenine methylase [Jaaginema sp. PMC 1079.18]|nr:DNA adenine methylase [Jaaginema sp. PMC 1080.18]MEC4851032.1 DNA adenine methylase [Jaaginema sp. PMC 1079.18]